MTVTGYHGSYRPITEFVSRRFEGVGGIYFTPSMPTAADLAEMACCDDGDRATVMKATLTMTNSLEMASHESQVLTIAKIDELVSQGYDSVIGMDAGLVAEYVVFDSEQVVVTAVIAVSEAAAAPSP